MGCSRPIFLGANGQSCFKGTKGGLAGTEQQSVVTSPALHISARPCCLMQGGRARPQNKVGMPEDLELVVNGSVPSQLLSMLSA